jgi:predicted amidohydrolase YtcJ
MLDDYTDLPNWRGLNVTPVWKIKKIAELAIQNGYQLCTHSIGDKANRETLNIYESTFKKHPEVNGKELRWRIEHAQHVTDKDKPRFAKLGIIAAMQGIHATSDAPFVVERLGKERARKESYTWRDLIDLGTVIANGTDSPVEKLDPIACYYASVTRMTKAGKPFFPEQKMTRMEALKSYTINGAYAAFQDSLLGTITPGKLADFTVLSQNILTVADWKIPNTKVLYTIIGGKVMYSRKQNN